MASSSAPVNAVSNQEMEIEHHNRTLPLTSEEIAELIPEPSLEEQFRQMQERLSVLEANNRDLKRRLQTKRVTLRSAIVIPDEEPSHRSGKEPIGQGPQVKKPRKHARDRYERMEDVSESEKEQYSQEKIPDRYQPSMDKGHSSTFRHSLECSETEDSASTNKTNLRRLERRIEEVALGQRESVPKVGEAISPFTARVLEHPLPDRFRMPSIPVYDGKTDPGDHIDTFSSWMLLQGAGPEVMCRAFSITLTGSAKRWYRKLKPNSIGSWKQLSRKFMEQFVGSSSGKTPKERLLAVRQAHDESLKDFINRYSEQALQVDDLNEDFKLFGISSGVRTESEFWWSLQKTSPRDYNDFLKRAQKYINAEEARLAARKAKPPKSYQEEHRERHSEDNRPPKKSRSGAGPLKPFSSKFDKYHKLNAPIEEIFSLTQDKEDFPKPKPIKKDISRRDKTKYCAFHADIGHRTADCFNLKEAIEALIRRGALKKFKAEQGEQEEQKGEAYAEISLIVGGPHVGGTSRSAQKSYVREAYAGPRQILFTAEQRPNKIAKSSSEPITFTAEDARWVMYPHNDPLVVSALIGNRNVHRILVDTGSAVDVLYEDTFHKMGLKQDALAPSPENLYGFTGDSIQPKGLVSLPITVGENPRSKTTNTTWIVVPGKSSFNAIIGRPTLQSLGAIASVEYLKMKFPTEHGVGEVVGTQAIARSCYANYLKESQDKDVHKVMMIDSDFDPRLPSREEIGPGDEVEEVAPDPKQPEKKLKIGKYLESGTKSNLITLLSNSLDIFAWSQSDMTGIDPQIACHRLNINPKEKPIRQKRRALNSERYSALKEEVEKLISNGSIKETKYPKWVANPVLVRKPNGKWRTCVDFTDLNKACPKDSFPMPRIDQLVDATAGHEILSFMDAYSGYNQIPMYGPDQDHTAFITDRGLYCYTVMPFGLKNAGATYQRLVNRMFAELLGITMEAYIDDLLVKSRKIVEHTNDLRRSFELLRQYHMKLNPLKCTFGVSAGKFLGFIVHERGIEVNPEKITALWNMRPPRNIKEVQKLTGCIAALSRFISRSTDRSVHFFNILRGSKEFEWTKQCDESFESLKEHLAWPPTLRKVQEGEPLEIYLAVSEHAVSSALIKNEGKHQVPVYYTSRRLNEAEGRYPELEKLAFALITASRKLKHYFLAHPITVLTNFPLRQVLQKPDVSGRLMKWSIELTQYDIHFSPRPAIKGQAVADFIAEFTYRPVEFPIWDMHVDGAVNEKGSGVGIALSSPEGDKVKFALKFDFNTSNNEAEYEAMIHGLQIAKDLEIKKLKVYSDSQLIVNQMKCEFQAKGEKMSLYAEKARNLANEFELCEITQVPRAMNEEADALAKHATQGSDSESIPVIKIGQPSIEQATHVLHIEQRKSWQTPIREYLQQGTLPKDKNEARSLKFRAARYFLEGQNLYKRGFSQALLKCLDEDEAEYALKEIHEGICGSHIGCEALAQKIIRQGLYWPTLKADARHMTQRCVKCQKFSNIPRLPPNPLITLSCPIPFAEWGIDLIGALPTGRGGCRYAIVAIDYFSKWVEAEPLNKITAHAIEKFVWKNIITRFGIPVKIVSDHGTQFDCDSFKGFCEKYGINKVFSTPVRPQSNGLVEAVNKTIKHGLKTKLDEQKSEWVDMLQEVLWSYRTTEHSATGETPFALAYGSDAAIPTDVLIPTMRRERYSTKVNNDMLEINLDLLEEKRENARLRNLANQQRVSRYFNRKVRPRSFRVGDKVLRRVFLHTKIHQEGAFNANWEGPYIIREDFGNGAYRLQQLSGDMEKNPWNAEHLRQFYV